MSFGLCFCWALAWAVHLKLNVVKQNTIFNKLKSDQTLTIHLLRIYSPLLQREYNRDMGT